MRKIIALIAFFLIIAGIVLFTIMCREQGTAVIRDAVVYKPFINVGSLYEQDLTFEQIDRTRPEGTLFSKTKSETGNQVEELYTASANNDEYMMNIIRAREISTDFKKEISKMVLLFSFYYYGNYGPPHWFCILDSEDGTSKAPLFMELENGLWRQCPNVAKYPVRVAFFDLAKKHNFFSPKRVLSRSDIDSFIADIRNIDDVISSGMDENPEHYGSVQVLE